MREVHSSRVGVAWSPRPAVAMGLRVLALVAPLLAAYLIAVLMTQAVDPPAGAAVWAWRGLVVGAGTATSFLVERHLRRVVSLSMLLKLSLVFPDRAPSRYSMALRTRTSHQLRRDVLAGNESEATQQAAERLLQLVAALNVHDRLTRGHSERVRAYARLIGEELELSPEDLERLNWAALLHDIGKLDVSAETLSAPGKLTDEQWIEIKRHPEAGARIAAPLRDWLGPWWEAIYDHHERWEGGGYPSGTAGTDISLAGRIVAVADAFDVMTSARSYQRPRSAAAAREELERSAGSQFDPEIVRAFLGISVGRLRLLIGPLSWLSQLPIVGNLPIPVGSVAGSAAAAVAATTALVVGSLSIPVAEPPQALAQSPSSPTTDQSADVSTPGTTPRPGADEAPASESTSTTSTTLTSGGGRTDSPAAAPGVPPAAPMPPPTTTTAPSSPGTTPIQPADALSAGSDSADLNLSRRSSVVVPIRQNDRDPAGHSFEIIALSTPSHGTVQELGNGSLRYTSTSPALQDTFTYTIRCETGTTSTATVTVDILNG